MPEELFSKVKKAVLPQWKVCFFTAIVVGFFAHLYKITNWLPNWDSYVFRYDSQNMLSLGRWFLGVASAASSFYDLPLVTGVAAIVLHAVGAVCICKLFGVQKNITAALIGAVAVSFPTVTSVLLYNYVADAYSLSFLLACIAALFMTREKPKFLLAAVLICLSVGIYQAYITVTITLLLCYLIVETVKKETTVKDLLLKSVKYILCGAAGMVLYYLVLTVILKVTHTSLLEYQGFSSAVQLQGFDILGSLYVIKETVLGYFFCFSDGVNVFGIVNIIVFVLTVAFYLIHIIQNKTPAGNILLLVIFVAFLPIGAVVLSFINSQIDYHNLMKMGLFSFYLPFILCYENAKEPVSLRKIKQWTILTVATVLVFNQSIIANISYHKLQMAYEKSYGILVRVADRIEKTDGAENCDSILVLGALANSEAYSSQMSPEITGTTDGLILRADDELVGQSVFCSALNDYCAKDYAFIAGEQKRELLKNETVKSLENWPSKQSVCVVDTVLVIKFGDET